MPKLDVWCCHYVHVSSVVVNCRELPADPGGAARGRALDTGIGDTCHNNMNLPMRCATNGHKKKYEKKM